MEDKIKYVDIIPDEFYKVNLVSFIVETDEFSLKKEHFTVIDSGTTISYLPTELFKKVIDRIKQVCNSKVITDTNKCLGYMHYVNGDLCVDQRTEVTIGNFFDSFPTINLKFIDFEVLWKPENYFVFLKDNTYCIGINEWG